MDYALGVAELAAALREGRPCRLPASLALHVNEVALAIQHSRETGSSVSIGSTFAPVTWTPSKTLRDEGVDNPLRKD